MPTPGGRPRLYADLAGWFPLLTAPEDYAEEAELYRRDLVAACSFEPRTMLELGCGGGNNASHLKQHFEMVLSDLSPEMLEVSRRINPGLEHVQGDMRTLRLGRSFDLVFAHDAVSYLLDEASVHRAVATAWEHLRPGGAALFAPDDFAETWRGATVSGGHDGPDGRGLRYVEWSHRTSTRAPVYENDFAYLLREADGSLRVEMDRHLCAAHPREAWLAAFRDAGFVDVRVIELQHSEVEPGRWFHLVGRKPA